MKISQVIYDMDGLMIDSEPFWQQAQIKCFAQVGIELSVEDCIKTKGIRIDEIVRMRINQAPEPYNSDTLSQQIIEEVIQLILLEGKAMPGLIGSLQVWKELGMGIHLASSSSSKIIHTTLDKLELEEYFSIVHSAEYEHYGKPHPAVYLTTAKKAGVEPWNCLAIEDSLNGAISAKAAQMALIVVPEKRNDPRFGFADLQLSALSEINSGTLKELGFV